MKNNKKLQKCLRFAKRLFVTADTDGLYKKYSSITVEMMSRVPASSNK